MEKLQAAIDEMNRDFKRPGMDPLAISDFYDLDSEVVQQYPGADRPGVYLLMNADREIRYVGKASFSHVVGKRLGTYFGYGPGRKGTICKIEAWKEEGLRYLAVISLAPKHSFEAGAIEEFLISRLRPRLTTIGVKAIADDSGESQLPASESPEPVET